MGCRIPSKREARFMRKYSDVLAEIAQAAIDFEEKKLNMTDEDKMQEMRELVSDMRKYMSIGSFAKNTPMKVTKEFKSLMSRANAIHIERLQHESRQE